MKRGQGWVTRIVIINLIIRKLYKIVSFVKFVLNSVTFWRNPEKGYHTSTTNYYINNYTNCLSDTTLFLNLLLIFRIPIKSSPVTINVDLVFSSSTVRLLHKVFDLYSFIIFSKSFRSFRSTLPTHKTQNFIVHRVRQLAIGVLETLNQ